MLYFYTLNDTIIKRRVKNSEFYMIEAEVDPMSYIPLTKVYYQSPDEYEEEWRRRRENPFSSYHIPFQIGEYPVFFLQLPELYQSIIELHRLDQKIHLLYFGLPKMAIQNFTLHSLIGEIVITNQFEGVSSSRREVRESLENLRQKQRAQKRFDGIVSKYRMLMTRKEIPLETPEDIRHLYDELLLEGKSEIEPENLPDGTLFRKESVSVTDSFDREIHRGLYPEEQIIQAMREALAVLKDPQLNPVLAIGLFHYLFGYIHPFYDGNGRMSRFISSYLLAREFHPIVAYRISYPIFQNRKIYEEAFRICNNPRSRGDVTPFLLMFTNIITQAMQGLYEALERRAARMNHYHKRLQEAQESFADWDENLRDCLFILIQVSLFSEDGINRQELAEACEYSVSTLMKQLNRLSELQDGKLLIREQVGREKHYRLDLNQLDQLLQCLAQE